MTLNEEFPLKWLYYHYFLRKPFAISILLGQLTTAYLLYWQYGLFPPWLICALLLSSLGLIFAWCMHQEVVFKAVDYPNLTTQIKTLPLKDEMEVAVIEYDGVTKCYPLDYVIHHHIINDKFNSKIVSLTYCAMCRSIIPFDVTHIGPLFVASFKNANMIVADRKTKTFFQQATFQSEIGKLHPYSLEMLPFQILSWSGVKKLNPVPPVVDVNLKDLRDFELPIHGVWKKIMASERTPGLSEKRKDSTFPSRTPVIGIYGNNLDMEFVYIKKEVLAKKIVENRQAEFFLISHSGSVNGFKSKLNDRILNLTVSNDKIIDDTTQTHWDLRGHYISGPINSNLIPIALSDEYWFSWKNYHPSAKLLRI